MIAVQKLSVKIPGIIILLASYLQQIKRALITTFLQNGYGDIVHRHTVGSVSLHGTDMGMPVKSSKNFMTIQRLREAGAAQKRINGFGFADHRFADGRIVHDG